MGYSPLCCKDLDMTEYHTQILEKNLTELGYKMSVESKDFVIDFR